MFPRYLSIALLILTSGSCWGGVACSVEDVPNVGVELVSHDILGGEDSDDSPAVWLAGDLKSLGSSDVGIGQYSSPMAGFVCVCSVLRPRVSGVLRHVSTLTPDDPNLDGLLKPS